MIAPPFPLEAPYRIDQVTQGPWLLAVLFLLQVVMALLMHLAAVRRQPRAWLVAGGALLLLVVVFFTLASWGNSDTTRFSHAMQWDPAQAPPEPFWILIRPLVLLLPYRMAAVHGLVVGGFAAAMLLLAHCWGARAWAGWWSLLICCSPILRGFMQNAHTRQALAMLLLLPLFLQAARLVRWPRGWIGLGVVGSALMHQTFVLSLPITLTPCLWRPFEQPLDQPPAAAAPDRPPLLRRLWRRWPYGVLLLTVLTLFLWVAPLAMDRFQDYAQDDYFNHYPLSKIIGRLQRALGAGLLLACVLQRLDPRRLLLCPITQLLLLFGGLYLGIQWTISHTWYPQITSRLADSVAFLMLVLYIAWLNHYRAHWCIIPALYVTFQYWFELRILDSGDQLCGLNDEFMCIPDRWPWQVRY